MMSPMSRSPLRASLAKDPREVAGMFDAVARRYDLTNDVMSLWQVRMWRRVTRAAVGAAPGLRVLDLAAGTGKLTRLLVPTGAEVVVATGPATDPIVRASDVPGFSGVASRTRRSTFATTSSASPAETSTVALSSTPRRPSRSSASRA